MTELRPGEHWGKDAGRRRERFYGQDAGMIPGCHLLNYKANPSVASA